MSSHEIVFTCDIRFSYDFFSAAGYGASTEQMFSVREHYIHNGQLLDRFWLLTGVDI